MVEKIHHFCRAAAVICMFLGVISGIVGIIVLSVGLLMEGMYTTVCFVVLGMFSLLSLGFNLFSQTAREMMDDERRDAEWLNDPHPRKHQ